MDTEEYLRKMHPTHMRGWHVGAVAAVVRAWDSLAILSTLPLDTNWHNHFVTNAQAGGWARESDAFWEALVADEKDRRHGPVMVGDQLEVLVPRPMSALLQPGDVVTCLDSNGDSLSVRATNGRWVVARRHVRKADVTQRPTVGVGIEIDTWLHDGEHPPATVDVLVPAFPTLSKGEIGRYMRHKWWLWMNRDEIVEAEPDEPEADPTADLRRRLAEAEAAHRRDIGIIGEVLLTEAESRDWCEEYDGVISKLNRQLQVELPIRMRTVTVTVNGFVRCPFTTSVTVEVGPDDDPVEVAREAFDSSEDVSRSSIDQYSAVVDEESLSFEEE